ncbi:MAG: DUF6688 family protein [Anaerolineales bacterium]
MEADDSTKPLPVPESHWERVLYALIVVVLPIVCFSLSDVAKPEWQSGNFSDYATLMLLPQVAWFFFPFLIYSVICLLLLLIAPQRFALRFAIRFGVYTGMALATQYVVLVTGMGASYIFISAAILILSKWFYGKVKPGWRVGYAVIWLVLIITIGLFIYHPSFQIESLKSFLTLAPLGALVVILETSPLLCFAVMAVTSVKLFKIYEVKPPVLLWPITSLIAWLAAYAFAWRFSILQAIEIYHSLPKSPPDCYIATASARGHRCIAHSNILATANGAVWVTTQLQMLKCAELALTALAPRLHALLRRGYDWFGPPLARKLTNPFLADLAYLTLKPFEWAATLILKTIVPEIDEYAGRLYSQK